MNTPSSPEQDLQENMRLHYHAALGGDIFSVQYFESSSEGQGWLKKEKNITSLGDFRKLCIENLIKKLLEKMRNGDVGISVGSLSAEKELAELKTENVITTGKHPLAFGQELEKALATGRQAAIASFHARYKNGDTSAWRYLTAFLQDNGLRIEDYPLAVEMKDTEEERKKLHGGKGSGAPLLPLPQQVQKGIDEVLVGLKTAA